MEIKEKELTTREEAAALELEVGDDGNELEVELTW
jgi:hypothetical protein